MIVLIAVAEKQVVITDQFNPAPITGRQAIFAKVSAQTETRLDAEVVGVYSDLDLANRARASHMAAHPGRRYIQKVATLDDAVPEPPESKCIMCGTSTPGVSYCPPCQKKHWERLREADPLAGAGDDVPVIPAGAGPDTRFVVTQ